MVIVAIALPLLLALGLGSQLPKLELDAAPETFLHPDDPIRLSWSQLRDQYGRDELILILVRPREVFDLGFLERLRDKTGNSVVVRRGDSHICTFLGRHEWKLAKKRMQR